jgi:hypothetical protein
MFQLYFVFPFKIKIKTKSSKKERRNPFVLQKLLKKRIQTFSSSFFLFSSFARIRGGRVITGRKGTNRIEGAHLAQDKNSSKEHQLVIYCHVKPRATTYPQPYYYYTRLPSGMDIKMIV